jgi:hypothetical protein
VYECGNWSLSFRKKRRHREFEKRVLGIISLDPRLRHQEKAGENCITKGFVIVTARKIS